MKILIVDDDPVTLTLLRGILTGDGHTPVTAPDAFEALRILRAQSDIELMITDINMPGMNGLELLRVAQKEFPILPAIVLTGREDRETVRQALKLGAEDYLDKPIQQSTLLASIQRTMSSPFRRHLRQATGHLRNVREAQAELMNAPDLEPLFQAGELALWYRPLADAGGDFAYGHALGGDRYLLTLVDAAGHDIQSSYNVAEFKGLLGALLTPDIAPLEMLDRLNRQFSRTPGKRHYCVLALMWHRAGFRLEAANAGLPHGLLMRADGALMRLQLDGMGIGMLDKAAFDGQTIPLAAGDRLLFFTDGVEEAVSRETLERVWQEHQAQALAVALTTLVKSLWLDSTTTQDDMLLLAFEQPAATVADELPVPPRLELALSSARRQIEPAIRRALEFIRDFGPAQSAEQTECMAAALREVVLNAALHGNRETLESLIRIEIAADRAARTIDVRVTDEGAGFNLEQLLAEEREASPLRAGGRGLLTAHSFTDRFEISGNGVHLHFRR